MNAVFAPRNLALETHLPEALAFLKRLVAVNSFTGNRAGLLQSAEIVAEQFQKLGFLPENVPAENPAFGDHLFLNRPGGREAGLVLVTHLDTVYPAEEEARNRFEWLVESDRIYGPGVNDNKGGTAMIWLVLAALREAARDVFEGTSWLIAANAAEEELARDFPETCRARVPRNCRAALIFEACGGSGRGLTLVRRRKGSANLRVTVEGRGAHAGSGHREGANAIVEMARLVEQMAELTDYSRDLTINVGSISGGGPSNRVPHHAECNVNVRAFDDSVLQNALDAILSIGKGPIAVRAVSDGFPCRVSIELLSRNPSWQKNAETDALIEIWMRSAKQIGLPLLAESRGGLSDGNYLSQFLPSLDGLGPFGLRGHSSERSPDGSKVPEFVVTSSFLEMGSINFGAIRELMSG
ncbi:MAG TPA: M20/M25/M40 family metallo-hydrolase [Terrimicrobiaceae bacterium]|nr:M20/M25/M40 family metallo-hydrolase [Terrimicrobiaceae bacterium]